ncbi:hypothetical protein PRIC1_010261 [Phytophthora ramorum]
MQRRRIWVLLICNLVSTSLQLAVDAYLSLGVGGKTRECDSMFFDDNGGLFEQSLRLFSTVLDVPGLLMDDEIDSGLNSHGYCRYHQQQDPDFKSAVAAWYFEPYKTRCLGIAVSTDERCGKDWDVLSNGYCEYHQEQAPVKVDDGPKVDQEGSRSEKEPDMSPEW